MISNDDLILKKAINLQSAARTFDRFWLDGIRGASDWHSFEQGGQRFRHNVRAVGLDRSVNLTSIESEI